MKKETLLYGVIGLVVGGLLVGFTATLAVNNNNQGVMRMMGMNTSRIKDTGAGHMGMSMNDMQAELQGKTGDDFDENFVAMMIAHHQGAIEMAKLADKNAKHQEVKDLSKDISSAQSKEIEMMQTWQTEWGYEDTPRSHMMH